MKPNATVVPAAGANWSKMMVHPHFIVWAIWARDETGSVLRIAITERKPHKVAWQSDCPATSNHLALTEEALANAYALCEKLERMWPCHFLAKEYNKEG